MTTPSANRARLGLRASATVFACGAPLYKYLPLRDRLFVELAGRLDDVLFVFRGDPAAPSTRLFAGRLRTAFAAAGFYPDRLLVCLADQPDITAPHWLAAADVHLDSIGWSDLPATRAALAHRLPVVTMPTGLQRGCASAQWLHEQGLAHGIAASMDDLVDLATALADPRRRAAYWQPAATGTATGTAPATATAITASAAIA